MAKTNAQIQSDYRERHLNKDKSRVQVILDKEVAAQLDALRDHYGVTKQAVIATLIGADWKRVAKHQPAKELKKLATPARKRRPVKKTARKTKEATEAKP